MIVDEIVSSVRSYPAKHVVLTGGEPMIAPEAGALTRALRELGLHITIETAGTVFTEVACDLMSISPKLANSTPREREGGRWAAQHERLRFRPEVLRRLMGLCAYQLKFVVASPGDIGEVCSMVSTLDAAPENVILMPEGTDAASLQERGRWLAEICKERGWRFSPRLHVDLWGNRRGV
jgi:7-carboxy-7-deazaguanine synthase